MKSTTIKYISVNGLFLKKWHEKSRDAKFVKRLFYQQFFCYLHIFNGRQKSKQLNKTNMIPRTAFKQHNLILEQ